MPENATNSEVVRAIADQLFDTWSLKQEQATKRRNFWIGSLPAWAALVMAFCSLVWTAAVIATNVADNTRRISQLEADKRLADAEDKVNGQSLARIEAKVDLLMGERGLRSTP